MKTHAPLVSVIVPVYNVEKYIRDSMNSIINQTYQNLEIILVNDGSTDQCPAICDEYAKRDRRIKVIHKTNEGVSSARNAGLDIATGDYIGFADSDDILMPSMYEFLLAHILKYNADISRCGMVRITGEKREEWGNKNAYAFLRNTDEGICDVGEAFGFLAISPCNKLFRKSIIEKIRFDIELTYAEDMLFNYYAAANAKKWCIATELNIAILPIPILHHIKKFMQISLMNRK